MAPKTAEDTPDKAQIILNAVLQIVGVVAAIVFGTFSVLAYLATEAGNTAFDQESRTANQLALLTICLNNDSVLGPLYLCF
jgi:hypothetical protein